MSGTERAGGEGGETALDESWLREIVEKANYSYGSPTILRVPDHFREAYTPKIIYLGPFFHRDEFEWNDRIKWLYLNRFVSRNPHLRLPDYIKEIKVLEQEARSAYPYPPLTDSNEFAERMLLDCCFVLEFLLVERQKKMEADQKTMERGQMRIFWPFLRQQQQPPTQPSPQQQQQPEEDPIASIGKWASPLIRQDILIIQNQIPLFLLQSLFEKATGPGSTLGGSIKFEDLVLKFFSNFSLFPETIETPDKTINEAPPRHLLHLFHKYMSPLKQERNDDLPHRLPSIPCARELREAKVKLVKKEVPRVLDIGFRKPRYYDVGSFWSWRLEIPQLWIDDDTDTLLWNLIAFERRFPEVGDHVSAYAWFMDKIVDNDGDVALLRQKNIVVNGLGSDKNVAQLFKQQCKDVAVDVKSSYLGQVVEDVTKHCEEVREHREKLSNQCWHSLKNTYCSNAWLSVGVAGGIILFVLTFLQTLYTILGYVKPKGNCR